MVGGSRSDAGFRAAILTELGQNAGSMMGGIDARVSVMSITKYIYGYLVSW